MMNRSAAPPEKSPRANTYIHVENSSTNPSFSLYLPSIPIAEFLWHDICSIIPMTIEQTIGRGINQTLGYDRFLASDYGRWVVAKLQEIKYYIIPK